MRSPGSARLQHPQQSAHLGDSARKGGGAAEGNPRLGQVVVNGGAQRYLDVSEDEKVDAIRQL